MVSGDNLPEPNDVEGWNDKFTQFIVDTMIDWMRGLGSIDQVKDYYTANKRLLDAIEEHKPEFRKQFSAALNIIKKEKSN